MTITFCCNLVHIPRGNVVLQFKLALNGVPKHLHQGRESTKCHIIMLGLQVGSTSTKGCQGLHVQRLVDAPREGR